MSHGIYLHASIVHILICCVASHFHFAWHEAIRNNTNYSNYSYLTSPWFSLETEIGSASGDDIDRLNKEIAHSEWCIERAGELHSQTVSNDFDLIYIYCLFFYITLNLLIFLPVIDFRYSYI